MEYTTNPYGFKCPECDSDDIFDCIDCGALTCCGCGHVWKRPNIKEETATIAVSTKQRGKEK